MTRVGNYLFIRGEDRGFLPTGLRPKALSAAAGRVNVLGGDALVIAVASAGAQMCMSCGVEIIAPAAHAQDGFQSVAVVSAPDAVVLV